MAALTLTVPEKLQLYGLYVYYVVHICDFGMLRVNTVMNGTAFFLPCHSGSVFSDWNIYNLDRTKSSFLATSL